MICVAIAKYIEDKNAEYNDQCYTKYWAMISLSQVPSRLVPILYLYPSGKGGALVKPSKAQGQSPRTFLGFTKALPFPEGYNGSYIPLGRDISYTKIPLP